MIRATQVRSPHRWNEPPADTIVLLFGGGPLAVIGLLTVLIGTENATVLRGGDALVLDDNRLIEVVAAPEPLAEIRGADPQHLVRIAWHLGNRHLPTEILSKALRIRRDPVIEAMAKGLGARVIALEAPFNPEGGAYVKADKGQAGRHDHGHDHGHGHPHEHDHEPRREDDYRAEHDHGAAHAKDLDHSHGHEHGHDRHRG